MEETPEYLNDSAVMFAAKGMHAEAIACLRKALLLAPKNSVLWFNLGLSLRSTDKLIDAREALFRAAEENPLDVDILDTLAVVLHECGEDEAGEETYLKALELSPGNGRVWNNYGVLLFGQGRFQDACHSFEKAVALVPDFEDALYNLHDTFEELGRTADMKKSAAMIKHLEAVRKKKG